MKYFVAHLLKKDAAHYHRYLTRTLAERFRTVPLHTRVDPHLTIKTPFEANGREIAEVEALLASFSTARAPEPFTIEGFGRFGFRTVYLDVVKSRCAVHMIRDCVSRLDGLPWIQKVGHEGNKLHSSVARFMTHKQFRRVWRFVQREHPFFEEMLDSLAILKKETPASAWTLHREFSLTAHQANAPLANRNLVSHLSYS